jgi:hypothetical protein
MRNANTRNPSKIYEFGYRTKCDVLHDDPAIIQQEIDRIANNIRKLAGELSRRKPIGVEKRSKKESICRPMTPESLRMNRREDILDA